MGVAIANYSKGARVERELLGILHGNGYAVVRAAGSGVNAISPDIVAMRAGAGIAIECKAWSSTSIAIPHEKFGLLEMWERNAGMPLFVGWRINGKSWLFIRLSEFRKTEKNYTMTLNIARRINRGLEEIMQPHAESHGAGAGADSGR